MTEEEILSQICAGSRAQDLALKALYGSKAAEFKRYFVHKGVQPDAAEDVLQEVIVKIFKNAAAYRGSGGHSDNSANAWMWTVARNCMNDHLGKSLGGGKTETTREVFDFVLRPVHRDDARERLDGQIVHELREDQLTREHGSPWLRKALEHAHLCRIRLYRGQARMTICPSNSSTYQRLTS
jgi:DNA-directed RNA polymerase specialized sigma24 family protein